MDQAPKKRTARKVASKSLKKDDSKATKKKAGKVRSGKASKAKQPTDVLPEDPISPELLLKIEQAQQVAIKAVQGAVYQSNQSMVSSDNSPVTSSYIAVSEAIASAQAAVVAAVQDSAQDANH